MRMALEDDGFVLEVLCYPNDQHSEHTFITTNRLEYFARNPARDK